MRRVALTGLVAAMSIIAGAASARSAPNIPLEEGTQDAVVYVYRTVGFYWAVRNAAFEFDAGIYGSIPNAGCIAMRVPAGTHTVGVSWPSALLMLEDSQAPVEATVTMEPGRRYYFRFDVRMKIDGSEWDLTPVEEVQALGEMQHCLYSAPKARKDRRLSAGASGRKPRK